MNPLVVAFTCSHNAQRDEIFNGIEFDLATKYKFDSYNPIDFDVTKNNDSFEDYYKASLWFAVSDVTRRSNARKNNIQLLLYKLSPIDIISYSAYQKEIKIEFKNLIKNNMTEHLKRFPINLLFYCESQNYDKKDPDFMKKEVKRICIDNMILKLLENHPFESVPLGEPHERVDSCIHKIAEKMTNR
jgi:hypothetical protein